MDFELKLIYLSKNSSREKKGIGQHFNLNYLYTVLLLISGLTAASIHYRYAFSTWFLREDSRHFSNGLLSATDLLSAFLTPQNSMGYYRPITKIFWALPEWLNLNTPEFYHGIAFVMLITAALFLMRLSFLLYRDALIAVLVGSLYILMPANAKPVYWISAIQNITAGLFVFAALTFRIEQWLKPQAEKKYQLLCLISAFFALSSREVAFGGVAVLLLVDLKYKKIRRSWDILLLLSIAFYYVFLMNPPFERVGVRVSLGQFFDGTAWKDLWDYSLSTFWSLGDYKYYKYPLVGKIVSATLLAAALIGPLFMRSLLLPSVLAAVGIIPFLLIRVFSLEYVFLFGAGMALLATGALAPVFKKTPRFIVFILFLTIVFGYYQFLGEARTHFGNGYMRSSAHMRSFIEELHQYSRDLPPYRAIEITDFGPYRESEAHSSHHFMALGLRKLIPDRIFLFRPEIIGTEEGTGISNPNAPVWEYYFNAGGALLRIRYTAAGFIHD